MVSVFVAEQRPAAPAAGTAPSWRRDIQGLRAVAVLMVVLFHARLPVPGGFTGVDVFFVISGYVITAMLRREYLARGTISFRTFYLRRFLRLWPALALVVTVVALLSLVLLSPFGPQQTMAATGIGAMLMSANLVIAHAAGDYFAVTAKTNPLLNTWSLSVEEQFYLVFPALLLAGWLMAGRRSRRIHESIGLVAIISVLSLVLSIGWSLGGTFLAGLTGYFGGPEAFAFYGPLSRVWEFGIGALIALLVSAGFSLHGLPARVASLGGIALVIASAFLITDLMPFPGAIAIIPVLGTALVILGGESTVVNRILAWRPMVAVGDWSYSWYLWHWPVIVFTALILPANPLALVLAAALSLIPAVLSYRFVETPLRTYRPGRPRRTGGIIAIASIVPIALCAGLIWGANTGWGGRFAAPAASTASPSLADDPGAAVAAGDGALPDATASPAPTADLITGDGDITADTTTGDLRAQHVAVQAGCVNSDIDPIGCRFGPAQAKGTVLVLGDSQAYSLADGIINAATSLGYDTVVSSRTGCPFLGRPASGANELPCRPWQKQALAYALESKPAAVVIANRSGGYVQPELGWRTAATDDGGAATSSRQAGRLWEDGIEGVVEPLRAAGIPVIIVSAVPEMPEFSDQRTLFAQAFGSKAYEVDRTTWLAKRSPADRAEAAVAERHPGTVIVDPVPALCGFDTCASAVDGVLRYQDETHLTVDGSLLLTPIVRTGLAEALSAGTPAQ